MNERDRAGTNSTAVNGSSRSPLQGEIGLKSSPGLKPLAMIYNRFAVSASPTGEQDTTPVLQYSSTPVLHHSITPSLPEVLTCSTRHKIPLLLLIPVSFTPASAASMSLFRLAVSALAACH